MSWLSKAMSRVAPDLAQIIKDPIGEIKRGPRGTAGEIFGGGDDDDDGEETSAPTLSSAEVDPEGELGALQNIRKQKYGRGAHNLAPASGSSILTGPN